MSHLRTKIKASARQNFDFSSATTAAERISSYQRFLKVESHRLRIWHRAGKSGKEICGARALLMDALLRSLFEAGLSAMSDSANRVALVALGGYGRAELNPGSDVDVMFLHEGELVVRGKLRPAYEPLVNGLFTTLWDLGLKVGNSVRTVAECVQVANQDLISKTSLLEARLIVGNADLFTKFQQTFETKCLKGKESAYVLARLQDQQSRRAKFGNTFCLQEPHLKNGCGGLRDYQNLLWIVLFKYRARSLAELEARELIQPSDRKQLEKAYDYLLRVRTDVHYIAQRQQDVLSRNLQPAVAHHLGFTERSRRIRVEKFMGRLYGHLRTVYLLTRTLEQRSLLPEPQSLLSLRTVLRTHRKNRQRVVDGFRFLDGYIHAASKRVFSENPRRLMRVFLHAQQRGLKLHADLFQLIRDYLPEVMRPTLLDGRMNETFLTLLNHRGNVAPILREMHEVGFLGKYLPEFKKLTCLVQHEFYHRYTADEHTLKCVEKLDGIWDLEDPAFQYYSRILHDLERPYLLYLALLLHDAGKAVPGRNHSEIGAALAIKVGRRLGLPEDEQEWLRFLVMNHLTMVRISQQRDIEDPQVVAQFARLVQTPEALAMLTLHTVADSIGTSDDLWNGFKDTLLRALHQKTLQVLAGSTEMREASDARRHRQYEEVRRSMPSALSIEELESHYQHLPTRYFDIHQPGKIVDDLLRVHRFMQLQVSDSGDALEPVVTWRNEPDRGYSTAHICTWDRDGMFSIISGCLTAAGMNILSARIFTRTDGIVLDRFYVVDAGSGNLIKKKQREAFEKLLKEALGKEEVNLSQVLSCLPALPQAFPDFEEERLPVKVAFDNITSEDFTIIDVESEDQLGLLYQLSSVLHRMGLRITLAKVSTEKGAAIDTFYVRTIDSGKVEEPNRQALIRAELLAAAAYSKPDSVIQPT